MQNSRQNKGGVVAKDVEIELKFQLLNPDTVVEFLSSNAEFKYESFQHDVYYDAPHRDFLENEDNISEWLRIRIEKDKAQINYKDWQPHDKSVKTHCIEYETNVDSYESLSHIFDALNFKKLVEVKKTRRAWMYMDTEVSIDSVEDLGNYLEIEYKGDTLADIAEVRHYLHEVAHKLGVKTKELDLKGYPFGLLEKKGLLKKQKPDETK
jgi:adenylate cyclase, class 2